jgi:hypothetical protein
VVSETSKILGGKLRCGALGVGISREIPPDPSLSRRRGASHFRWWLGGGGTARVQIGRLDSVTGKSLPRGKIPESSSDPCTRRRVALAAVLAAVDSRNRFDHDSFEGVGGW